MNKFAFAALILSVCGSGVADAAVVSRTFSAKAVFTDGGPISVVNFNFGISFDSSGSVFFNRPIDYFIVDSSNVAFNNNEMKYFSKDQSSNSAGATAVSIYSGGNGISSNQPDFLIRFEYNNSSPALVRDFFAIYSVGDGKTHLSGNPSLNSIVETTPVATAVPEPAAWAMMIGGFALVGGAMRRRKRVAVAFA